MRLNLPLLVLPFPLLLLPVAACSSTPSKGTLGTGSGSSTSASTGGGGTTSTTGSGGTTSTTGTGGGTSTTSTTTTSGAGGAGGADGGALPPGTALVRVHYPAGTHTVTIQGSGAGLTWTTGQPTMAAGADTFTYTVSGIAAGIEWKPLLDDTTYALGPNYHVSPGQTLDVWPHFMTVTGQVQTLIASFSSTVLGNTRPIYAYLPPSYYENTDATYPVVYMHDGQNLWATISAPNSSPVPWGVDTTFNAAAARGACSSTTGVGWGGQPFGGPNATCNSDGDCGSSAPWGACQTFPEAIVIGVANTEQRTCELTPTPPATSDTSSASLCAMCGSCGEADKYLQMLTQELMKDPHIQALRMRTDVASTALCGSSLGGLVTAYAGLKYPKVFGLLGELSPSTWWNNDVIVADVMTTLPAPNRPLRVYVDSGLDPSISTCYTTDDDEVDTDQLAAAYESLGYVEGQSFHHVRQPMACHDETYWAERFPGAMQFLLGVR